MEHLQYKVIVLYAKGLLGKLPSFAEANLIHKNEILHDAYNLGVQARQMEHPRKCIGPDERTRERGATIFCGCFKCKLERLVKAAKHIS
jgi:hypothetical protein